MHLSPCWPRCPPALLPTDLHINQPSMGACAAGMSCWPWEHRLRATHHPPASKTGVTPTGHQGSLPTAWRWRPQVATATRSWQSLAPHTTRCPPARFALPSHHIPLILTHSSHPITFIRDSILSVTPVSMSVLPTGGRVQMSGRYDACFVPRAIGTCSGEAWRPPWRGESTTRTDFPPASMPQTLPSSCVGAYLAQSHQPAQLPPLL